MKKTYINPETRIVFVTTHTVIAGSNPAGFSGGLDYNNPITDTNQLLSRENYNLWDDDEEE